MSKLGQRCIADHTAFSMLPIPPFDWWGYGGAVDPVPQHRPKVVKSVLPLPEYLIGREGRNVQ